jgi:hypothetical protein
MDKTHIRNLLSIQPDVLFEDTNDGFRQSPLYVKRKGCLHSSWARFSVAVSVLEASIEGMYHKTHLERVGSTCVFNLPTAFSIFHPSLVSYVSFGLFHVP